MGQWVAAMFGYLFVFWPRVTRFVAAVFTVLTLSDLLHHVFAWLGKEAGY